MAEKNSWLTCRYGMKKLPHCHRMYWVIMKMYRGSRFLNHSVVPRTGRIISWISGDSGKCRKETIISGQPIQWKRRNGTDVGTNGRVVDPPRVDDAAATDAWAADYTNAVTCNAMSDRRFRQLNKMRYWCVRGQTPATDTAAGKWRITDRRWAPGYRSILPYVELQDCTCLYHRVPAVAGSVGDLLTVLSRPSLFAL